MVIMADSTSLETCTVMDNMLMIHLLMLSHHGKTRSKQCNTKITCIRVLLTEKFWFRFTVENDGGAYATGSYDAGVNGVNNMNTMPMQNIEFTSINSIGQQWIRRFSLALSKETLGQVRGKFGGNVPIPGDNITLNASDLLGQAAAEQTALREELNKQLDEMLYSKLAETDKAMVENMDAIVAKTPLKIFVG